MQESADDDAYDADDTVDGSDAGVAAGGAGAAGGSGGSSAAVQATGLGSTNRTSGLLGKAVKMVMEKIQEKLQGKQLALAIDGGTARLLHGGKVVATCAVGPTVPYDMLLHLDFLTKHETAESQAAACDAARAQYALDKAKMLHIVADNASVNAATVDRLNQAPYRWDVGFVRCMPHCLNLCITAFLKPFEDRFNMSRHLRDIRTYYKHSPVREQLLREYGLTLSGIDFSETRWSGFLQAVNYYMTNQKQYELKRAQTLQERRAALDPTAAAELEDPDAGLPRLRYDVMYEVTEECALAERKRPDAERGDDTEDFTGAGTSERILAYNADVTNYGAFFLIFRALRSAPALFTLVQGGAQWKERLGNVEGKRTAVQAIKGLIGWLKSLGTEAYVDALVGEVMAECERHQAHIMDLALLYGDIGADDVPARTLGNTENRTKAERKLRKAVKEARNALVASAALAKLEEALAVQIVRERYDIALPPQNPPPVGASYVPLFEFLGVPAGQRTTDVATCLRVQWTEHMATWRPRPVVLTQGAVYAYWQQLATTAPELAKLAMYHWCKPMSSAACERVYSHLTNIDSDRRQNMTWPILHDVLFLRANWRVVCEVVDEHVAVRLKARMHALEAGIAGSERALEKRQRLAAGGQAAWQAAIDAQVAFNADEAAANGAAVADDSGDEAELSP